MKCSQFFIVLANIYLASVMENKKTKNIVCITYILLALLYSALGE